MWVWAPFLALDRITEQLDKLYKTELLFGETWFIYDLHRSESLKSGFSQCRCQENGLKLFMLAKQNIWAYSSAPWPCGFARHTLAQEVEGLNLAICYFFCRLKKGTERTREKKNEEQSVGMKDNDRDETKSRSYYTSVKHRMRLGSRLIYLYLHQTTNNNEKEGKEDVLRTNWPQVDNDIWHHLTLVVNI